MGQTLEKWYQSLRERLQPVTRSPEQAAVEAGWILHSVLGVASAELYTAGDTLIPDSAGLALNDLMTQRVEKRIPLQYLLHEAWFYGLKFYVNPHVLIPRPETELLVEEALTLLQNRVSAEKPRLADIGTGPGAIAIALSHQLKDTAEIVATDISKEALRVAHINQRSLGTRVDFRQGDLLAPLAGEQFDLILSNPPYIDPALRPALDAEVAGHEPELALFSPVADAYHYYRRLAEEGRAYLRPGGHLLVEMGADMSAEIRRIFEAAGYGQIRIIPDYAGIDRILVAAL